MAYIVPALPLRSDRIESVIETVFPRGNARSLWVPVARIPLTRDGAVDEASLACLPVYDPNLINQWNKRLKTISAVGEGVAAVDEFEVQDPLLHLSDLIPGWKSTVGAGLDLTLPFKQESDGAAAKEAKVRPPALSDGGPLLIPADAPKTFTEAILRTAEKFPNKGITHVRADGTEFLQTYPELLQEARRILTGLRLNGLHPGSRVILQVQPLSAHFAAFWACVLGGITPVNVATAPSYTERNAIVNKLHNTSKLLGDCVILASDSLCSPLAGLEKLYPGDSFKVLSIDKLKKNEPATEVHPCDPDDLVFFQLTSGSTGIPKCIQESHRSVIAHIHGSAQFNGYASDDVCLNWLPMDHVVPTLTVNLKDVYLGCQEIQVETNAILSEPLLWLDLIEKYKVTHTWAPNFGFKRVSERLALAEDKMWDLSSIKYFMNAGEQVTLPVVREFSTRVAPFGVAQNAMQPSFGMAEACTCMTYANDFTVATCVHRFLKSSLAGVLQPGTVEDTSTIAFVDLGPPIPGVQIRIADSKNRVVPEGTIGRFQIKGDVITRGYLYNDEANRESFVGDGWFNSGDLGFIWDGRLSLTGREKEIIIVRGANFYCYEIEDTVDSIPGVVPTFSGSCAVSDAATGTESLAIFFVPQENSTEEKVRLIHEIRTAVASNLGITPAVIVPLTSIEFPKTTSGKIQRNQLKLSLLAGQYDSILKEMDLAIGNQNTVPGWFFRKAWRPKNIKRRVEQSNRGATLMFLDAQGLGESVSARLKKANAVCVEVRAGENFAKANPHAYQINPAKPGDYQKLLASVAVDGIPIARVLHFPTYQPYSSSWTAATHVDRTLETGALSLLFLVQALGEVPESSRPSRLMLVSCNSQRAAEGDLVDCTRSVVLGMMKTIPQEMPWLACEHVDIQARNVEEDAALVLLEIESHQCDTEVAWRDGVRLIPGIEPVDFHDRNRKPPPIQSGGLYLLSGGLGGVGCNLAKYLLQKYEVRLLILGRTALPERAQWSALAARGGAMADRIRALQELERLGDVAYEAADVADSVAVEAAVDRAKARWQCELNGVIHLAGLYQERLLSDETKENVLAVLRSKVQGSLVLSRLLGTGPEKLFLSFSSVYGFFGGFSIGAYSAANAFVDSFTEVLGETCGVRSQCLAWSLWDETGMSRGFAMKDLARAHGYHSILPLQGIHSLASALQRGDSYSLIGLDAARPAIRRLLHGGTCALQQLSVYYVSGDPKSAAREIEKISLADSFGSATRAKAHALDALPLTPNGELDRQRLAAMARANPSGGELPRTAIEKAAAAIWATVLGVDRVLRYDNFFDLGGHSLLAIQISFQIRERFNVEFPLEAFLMTPVLSAQAERIEQELIAQANEGELELLLGEIEQEDRDANSSCSPGENRAGNIA